MLSRLLTWLALWHFTLPVVSCWAVITELTEPVCKMCLSVVFLNIGCETRKLNSAVICHCQNSIKCKQLCMWKFDTDVTYGWSQNMFNWLGVCDEPVLCTGMYRMVQVFFCDCSWNTGHSLRTKLLYGGVLDCDTMWCVRFEVVKIMPCCLVNIYWCGIYSWCGIMSQKSLIFTV